MAIVKFDPFRGFESMIRKMDDFLGDWDKGRSLNVGDGVYFPSVDIRETDKNIFVQAEIPGIAKKDVKVTVNDDNILVIRGEKKEEEKKEEDTMIRMERQYGSFTRSFVLPENVKKDNIKAKFNDGVLNIELVKTEPSKPKEIEVKID